MGRMKKRILRERFSDSVRPQCGSHCRRSSARIRSVHMLGHWLVEQVVVPPGPTSTVLKSYSILFQSRDQLIYLELKVVFMGDGLLQTRIIREEAFDCCLAS